MATISELVQANFKLNADLREVRNELVTLKAMKQMEDAEEVVRIKSAYDELEQEVVALRQAIRAPDVSSPEPTTTIGQPETMAVIAILSDQLASEREKFSDLEQRYLSLRAEYLSAASPTEADTSKSAPASVAYSDLSTCVGSPYYGEGKRHFSIESFSGAVIAPPLEPMFKPTVTTRRSTLALTVPSIPSVEPPPAVMGGPKRRPSDDAAVSRLSKIARFKPKP